MDSKPIYWLDGGTEILGLVWETSKGRIVILYNKNINTDMNLIIREMDGTEIKDIDWRNVLMDIIPVEKV